MNARNAAVLTILLLLLFAVIAFLNPRSEGQIKREIEQARYCDTKNDCTPVNSQCPFGCYVIVNKNEAQRIEQLISSFRSTCTYSCIELKGFDCINKKCEPLY